MQDYITSIPLEVKSELLNLARIITLLSLGVFLIVFIIVIIDRQKQKDYSDETGFKNFRYFNLSWLIILIIVFTIAYAILLGISL
mgnify:CR=1 FL=1